MCLMSLNVSGGFIDPMDLVCFPPKNSLINSAYTFLSEWVSNRSIHLHAHYMQSLTNLRTQQCHSNIIFRMGRVRVEAP